MRKRRKFLRGLKKNQQDTEENTEGTLYEPGEFVEWLLYVFFKVIVRLFFIFDYV